MKRSKVLYGLCLVGLWVGISLNAATFDWQTQGWDPDGNLSQDYTDVNGSGIDISVRVTGDTDAFIDSTPKLDDDDGNLDNDNLELYVDYDTNTQSVTVTFTFSVPVRLYDLLWRDIDYYSGSWRQSGFDDKIIVQAKDADGNTVYDSNRTLGDHIESNARGEYESDDSGNYTPEDLNASVRLDFADTYVTELSFTYTNGDDAPDDPGSQAIWFDNFEFFPRDTDGDGIPDFQDIDDDNDGILDAVEMQGGGACSYGFFQVIGGQLKLYDVTYRTYLDIGTDKLTYNGMGYDPGTGKLYASVRTSGSDDYGNSIDIGDLISVDRYSGKIKLVYDGDRTASGSANSAAADFYDGKLYFRNTDDDRVLYAWDRETNMTSKIGSTTIGAVDFAIIPDASGHAYAYGAKTTDTTSGDADNTELYVIDLADGSVTTHTMTVTTPDGGDLSTGWGAAFVANGNELYLANNEGYIYRIDDYDTDTPTAVFEYRSEATNSNDGASCHDANQFPPDSDGDGVADYLDLDSDNDGIPDNVEAQPTDHYVAPSGVDADRDGLDDAYDANTEGPAESVGLIPPDRDGDLKADFLDADSDNDGYSDCEEGTTNGEIAGNCPATDIRGDGFPTWAVPDNTADYADINGIVDNPQDTDQMQNETGNTDEMAWREFLCGKNVTTLTERNWKLISLPCDTGSNTVQDVFSQLGTYGDDQNFVLYKQTGTDNYEVNATPGSTHKNTDKVMLSADDTLEQGISYWIIWDNGNGTPNEEINITIDKTLSGLSPTPLTSTEILAGINDPDFNETMLQRLPNNDMQHPGWVKKYMAGNPFPYAFEMKKLYFAHDPADNDYYPMGDGVNDSYITPTFYKHDSPDTTDKDTSSGGGYEAVNAGTPGFDNGGFKAMEGFFIQLPEVSGDTNDNYFAYPLIMKNGNGN